MQIARGHEPRHPAATPSHGSTVEVVRELPLDQVMLGDCIQLMRMLPPA